MSGGAAHALVVSGLTLRLRGRALFGPISFTVTAEAPTTVMGPSGCGKSSLLNWLTGTLPAVFDAEGSATVGGRALDPLPAEQRRLGILFQDDLLFPHLTVGENLAFAIPQGVRDRSVRREAIETALREAGLQGLRDRDPTTLSGGQRARVALLRALLCEPLALLLDEPFNKLDGPLKTRFRAAVFETARARGLPVLMVSHDPADAVAADGPVIALGADSEPEI
ncbi:MAG TPA: ATP-binding cassette domain-containing protein [Candidatus Cybelea sp.]|nr:ATP-binding cassette domain-containing protein [Candidatus Cybelea sp.]